MSWKKVLRTAALAASFLGAFGAGLPRASAQTPPAAAPPIAVPQVPAPQVPNPEVAAPQVPAPPAVSVPKAPSVPMAPDATDAEPNGTAPADSMQNPDKNPPDTSISQTLQLEPRKVIMLSGQATWDDGFKTLNNSFTKLNDNLAKANIHSTGNPLAVFTETDDAGFKFTAMIPIDKVPEGKPNLDSDVSFGDSPAGKAMKFQHRSAYDDIDSTYEAITAYLDEKGLEAKNIFAEEYLNRTKSPDDPSLEVDIYVFLKDTQK